MSDTEQTKNPDETENYKHRLESEEWNRGDREANMYQEALDESKRNPLSQHGDGPMNKVVEPEEMPWEDSPQGRIKHVINEKMSEGMDVPARGTDIYIQEIPPGSKSGKHRHMSEELVFVIEGDGYDLHWDPTAHIEDEYEWEFPDEPQRFDWETEDVIYIPTNTAHQHVNASEDEPARILCCQARVYNQLGFGMKDLEQFETAPEYEE